MGSAELLMRMVAVPSVLTVTRATPSSIRFEYSPAGSHDYYLMFKKCSKLYENTIGPMQLPVYRIWFMPCLTIAKNPLLPRENTTYKTEYEAPIYQYQYIDLQSSLYYLAVKIFMYHFLHNVPTVFADPHTATGSIRIDNHVCRA